MLYFHDLRNKSIRLTDERLHHLETDHPEMVGQTARMAEMLADPDRIVRSRTDATVELFYKWYTTIPVTTKFLCVVVKVLPDDNFIITSYYTEAVKRGRGAMGEEIKIWYDQEGDYLEVLFEHKAGYFRETEHDAVMERVDSEGNLLGFSILKVSTLRGQQPLSISLKKHIA